MNGYGDNSLVNLLNTGQLFAFINQSKLVGLGVGYIDAHLLASVRLMPGTLLLDAGQALVRSG